MRILVVCQYYYPEEFQINAICEDLVQRGHRVTVLTGLPNYPTGIIPEEYRHGRKRQELHNGVHIVRCFEISRRPGIIGLAENYLSFCISSSIRARQIPRDFDVIYIYQLSPVLMGLPGILLKKLTSIKVFLYCCDLWPESVKIMKIYEESLLFKIVHKVSSYIYRHCDAIGIQSKAFFAYFSHVHGIENDRLRYIPQFADSVYLTKIMQKKHEGFNFVFLGNIGVAQNLDCLVEAVAAIRDKATFKIHVVGDGSYLTTMKMLVERNGLQKQFVFYGRRPSAEMEQFYEIADVCILTLRGDSVIGQTLPSKLQGYMAAGKPIVAAIDGPAQEVIKESACGLAAPAGDGEALGRAMLEMQQDFERYQDCGENGRRYFKAHFTKKQYVDEVEKVLQSLVEA